MIFVDNIKKESMTLSELIRKHDFESILPSMKEFYEDARGCLAPKIMPYILAPFFIVKG